MTEQKSCADRIDDHLKGRLESLLPDFDGMTDEEARQWFAENYHDPEEDATVDDIRSEVSERAMESVLSVSKKTVYNVMLSWGGPEDGFALIHDGEAWVGGQYYFKDWFDGARRDLTEDQVEALADLFCVGPEFE